MNSFKLFNRTNKNDIVSNYLNEVEYKEKDNLINDNEPNINKITTTNFEENRIENTSDQENDDNKEKIVVGHHYFEKDSSIISKESSNELSEKEQKKTKKKEKRKKKKHKKEKSDSEQQESSPTTPKPKSNGKSHFIEGFLHHSPNPSKKDFLTDKNMGNRKEQKHLEIVGNDVKSDDLIKKYDETSQFQEEHVKEKQSSKAYKNKKDKMLTKPERKANKNHSNYWNRIIEKNESQPQILITTPSSVTHSFTPEISEGSQLKSDFENDLMFNANHPIGFGMTPSSPALSSTTPSIGSDRVRMTNSNDPEYNSGEGLSNTHDVNLDTMVKEGITQDTNSLQNRTENDQMVQEYKTDDNTKNEFHDKNHDVKSNKKLAKLSKKKEKKRKAHLSINTNLDSNSSSSVSSLTPRVSRSSLSPNLSDTKKKAWKSFKKLFGKKTSKKKYHHDSLSPSNNDSHQNTNITSNSGINYDWDELRHRMELEENNDVCTEKLTAREFAEAVGIPIVSSSDEEDDILLKNESDYSLLGGGHTTHSYYGHTYRSTKSSGPPLDMSIFIPPNEEEKKIKNNSVKHEYPLLCDNENSTAYSHISSSTQDCLDRLGNNYKRKVYGDS